MTKLAAVQKRKDTPSNGVNAALNPKEISIQALTAVAELRGVVEEIREAQATQTMAIKGLVDVIAALSKTVDRQGEEVFKRLGSETETASLAVQVKQLTGQVSGLAVAVEALPTTEEIKTAIAKAADDAKAAARGGAMVGGGVVSILAELAKAAAGAL